MICTSLLINSILWQCGLKVKKPGRHAKWFIAPHPIQVLTGGYQARAQGLIKQIGDLNDQIGQARLDLSTFAFLKDQETRAIPKR